MSQITVVSVPVSDQDRVKRFYVDDLGFTLVADATWGDDLRWLQVTPPGSSVGLTLVTWFDSMPAGSLRGLVIDTDDLDAEYAALRRRGVNVRPPSRQAGGTFCFVRDPDGNVLSFHQAGSA